ncbi:MAG TPA: hypothetical protein DCD97_06810 [Firmicutes bacterium]|jgi:uncharacterized protein YrrD|nr:hypothetical protein [Bacillota bacterium]HAA35008.1 hypothetical protein [Bacillota bacterium]
MMKKSKEIIGSPVISIADGVQIGTIKGLIVNPQQKSVEFLLLDEKSDGPELKGIPFRSAEAVGEFAVTIEDKGVLIDMMKVGILQELIETGVDVIGTKVITKKGKYLGDVSEYAVDTVTGKFAEFYYMSEGKAEKTIMVENVITIGKEVLVVGEEAEVVTENIGENQSGSEKMNENFRSQDKELSGKENISTAGTTEQGESPGGNVKASFASEMKSSLDPAGIFVQRQRQSLIGKTLIKDIKLDSGEIIARENTVVTEELFNKIYEIGAQKLMELAVSVKE